MTTISVPPDALVLELRAKINAEVSGFDESMSLLEDNDQCIQVRPSSEYKLMFGGQVCSFETLIRIFDLWHLKVIGNMSKLSALKIVNGTTVILFEERPSTSSSGTSGASTTRPQAQLSSTI